MVAGRRTGDGPGPATSPPGSGPSEVDRLILPGTLALFLILALVVLTSLPGGRSDDAEILLHAQGWAWGYRLRNPPLFEWLALAMEALAGPSVAMVIALRLACVSLTWGLLFVLGRRLGLAPYRAGLAAMAPAWVPQFFYYALFDLTHTVLAGVFYVALVLMIHHARQRPSLGRMAALGVVTGLGLLTKHFYLLFVLGALGACAWHGPYRTLLRPVRLAMAVAAALLVVIPYGGWALGQDASAWAHQQHESLRVAVGQAAAVPGLGLLRIVRMLLAVLAPWGVIGALLAWRSRPMPSPQAVPLSARWLLTTLGLTLLVILAVWLGMGAQRFEAHHLYFLILLPVAGCLCLPSSPAAERFAARGVSASVAWTMALLLLFMADNHRTAQRCTWCGPYLDYADLARTLGQAGLSEGTLYFGSHTRDLSVPALLPHLPLAVVRVNVPASESPVKPDPRLPCGAIWQPGRDRWMAQPRSMARLPRALSQAMAQGRPTLQWQPRLLGGQRLGQPLALVVAMECSR